MVGGSSVKCFECAVATMLTENKLVPGTNVPLVGLGMSGVFKPDTDDVVENTVETALKIGYRLLDTAYCYLNEEPIGVAIKDVLEKGIVKREEIFVITKLPGIAMHPDRVEKFLRKSLENLKLDYVDMYLVHWPIGFKYYGDDWNVFPKIGTTLEVDYETDLIAIWKVMEQMCQIGLTKKIGLSNFNVKQIQRIMDVATVKPSMLQVELNVHFQQPELVQFCNANNIVACAYAPLGSPGRTELYKTKGLLIHIDNLLDNPTLVKLANAYDKTPAQIALRFLTQQDIVVIPKSTKEHRLIENFNISDFTLSEQDMETLRGLDKGPKGRTFDMAFSKEAQLHSEFPFETTVSATATTQA